MTVEEVIARAAFEECEHFNGTSPDAKRWTWDDMPCDELDPRAYWLRKARAILSALKAAGLVIVPEEPTFTMMDTGTEYMMREYDKNKSWEEAKDVIENLDVAPIYRAMIRTATGREG